MPKNYIEYKLQQAIDKKELEKIERTYNRPVEFAGSNLHSKLDREKRSKGCGCKLCGPEQKASAYPRTGTITVDNKLEENALKILLEAGNLLSSKHSDYGSRNISDAPGGALNGLSVRLHDKVARLNNLLTSGKNPNHESLRDTFIDIVNYGIISLLVIDGKWDSTK